MGTRMAPSYANLFMGRLESRILAEAERKPDVWWRYSNDVFAIWTHGESHLKEFLQQINQVHSTIKFTAEWSFDSVTFLDVRSILKDGSIQTDLYSKPTDIHQYLAMDSCHPRHCKQAYIRTCKTKNLVYLIECRKCRKQYVGETENALHIRLNGHRSDIRTNKTEKPVAEHFNLPGHYMENLTIMVIDKIGKDDVQLRRGRESYWIHHLRSMAPEGLNLDA